MILVKNKNHIQYIRLNFYSLNISTINDCFKLKNIGETTNKYSDGKTYLWNANGIYLGPYEEIIKKIESKLNNTDISTFTNVYFDSTCKYPRFKLESITSIKRTLKPDKADSVIISLPKLETYSPYDDSDISDQIVIILYSPLRDCYFIIDQSYKIELSRSSKIYKIISQYININDPNLSLETFINTLLTESIIPSDCKQIYKGQITLLETETETTLVNNIFNTYKSITLDTDFNRYIYSKCQKMTREDYNIIDKMLKSSDSSTVRLGIKLLYNYDLESYKCLMGILIISNWDRIKSLSDVYSISFKQLLKSLNLTHPQIKSGYSHILINKLYERSSNLEDKAISREIIKQIIYNDIINSFNIIYRNQYNSFNFTYKVTIE